MLNGQEKAQALLACAAGAAVVLDISANLHLALEHFAEPKISFWLASMAIDTCDFHGGRPYTDLIFREAKNYDQLALQIVTNPAFAWWYEPFDPDSQVWTSPRMPHSQDPIEPFTPHTWQKPGLSLPQHDPIPNTYAQITSTLRGDSTSELTAFSLYTCDHICDFPLASWQVRLGQNVRVREINHPADWHDFCLEFPHRARDGGLTPNWPEVADVWDGIHVTLGGILSCDQTRYERDGEWSMMKFCHAEQTWWLDRLAMTGERLPDINQDHNTQILKPYPFDPDELRARASFVLK